MLFLLNKWRFRTSFIIPWLFNFPAKTNRSWPINTMHTQSNRWFILIIVIFPNTNFAGKCGFKYVFLRVSPTTWFPFQTLFFLYKRTLYIRVPIFRPLERPANKCSLFRPSIPKISVFDIVTLLLPLPRMSRFL